MNSFKNQCKGGMHPIIRSAWYKEGEHARAKGKFIQLTSKELLKVPAVEGSKKETQYTMPPCICGIPDFYGIPNTILVVFHPKLGLVPAYVESSVGEDILGELELSPFSEKELKGLKWIARFYEVI
jgi:hypothetical protein